MLFHRAILISVTSLTADDRKFFDENGYLVKRGLISREWIEQVKEEITDIHERMAAQPTKGVHLQWETPEDASHPKRIMQLMHSELISPTLNRILRCDATMEVVEGLLGPDVSLFHSKLLLKAARYGAAIPWHQDYAYWKREDNRPLYLNCQLAIDPATRENGCLEFVRGSHKWGLQEHEREQRAFGVFIKGHYQPRPDATVVESDAGDAVFFGPLIIHGSGPNLSDKDRRMNTFAYVVTGNDALHCREVLRGKKLEKPPTTR